MGNLPYTAPTVSASPPRFTTWTAPSSKVFVEKKAQKAASRVSITQPDVEILDGGVEVHEVIDW